MINRGDYWPAALLIARGAATAARADDGLWTRRTIARLAPYTSDRMAAISAGVGINLAIQDAVAAARILVPSLRRGRVGEKELARVQRRRQWPTVITQGAQRKAQERFVTSGEGAPLRVPQPLRALRHWPGFPHLIGRVVGLGIRPEYLTGSLEPLSHG